MALSNRNRNDVRAQARVDVGWEFQDTLGRSDRQYIAFVNLELARGLGVYLRPRSPHDRRHRIGHLLQPGEMRSAAVSERRRWIDVECERKLLGIPDQSARGHRCRWNDERDLRRGLPS